MRRTREGGGRQVMCYEGRVGLLKMLDPVTVRTT